MSLFDRLGKSLSTCQRKTIFHYTLKLSETDFYSSELRLHYKNDLRQKRERLICVKMSKFVCHVERGLGERTCRVVKTKMPLQLLSKCQHV